MTLTNNTAPLLINIKLYASFHHMWIQTGVTVRKRLSWVMTSVTVAFDLWPWPFAWTSPLSLVITENFVMIRWSQEHREKRCDRQTDGRTDRKRCSQSCLVAAKNVWSDTKFIQIGQVFAISLWSAIVNSPFRELAARGTSTNQIAASWMLQATWLATVASRHIYVWQTLLTSL